MITLLIALKMDCTLSAALVLSANWPLLYNGTSLYEFGWVPYLAQDSSDAIAAFNHSATLDAVRNSLASCREWDQICQDPSHMFANPKSLAVCSLYPNLTSTANQTSERTTSKVESGIPTCLISYCALAPLCSTEATTNCSISSLITSDGHLSSLGVGRCWWEVCYNIPSSVNSDIAGVGVSNYNSHLECDLLTASADNLILDADPNRTDGFCDSRCLQSASCLSIKEKLGSRQVSWSHK